MDCLFCFFLTFSYMSRKWFTLVELMIVIAIIGILAAVLYPAMGKYFGRARDTTRITDLGKIGQALRVYEIDHGFILRTESYGWAERAGWDLSSLPIWNPNFVKFLVDGWYIVDSPKDPLNNTTSDIGWWTNQGFTYFYYCYPNGSMWLTYNQIVLGARLENPFESGSSIRGGRMWGGDGTIFYFGRHDEWEGENEVEWCK